MTVSERLAALRSLMKRDGIDAYMVPTDDFHNSEYVGDYFKCRKFISGFTGSAGTALITQDFAGVWTDGRYFLQAAAQLEGTGFTLMKMGEEGVPNINAWLKANLTSGQVLGFDGRTVNALAGETLTREMAAMGVKLDVTHDLVGEIWTDRPALSCRPVWILGTEFCGQERTDKFAMVREAMKAKKASHLLLTSLDDIAWLMNYRGDDVECNPVVLSYVVMTQEEVLLFAQAPAFSAEVRAELEGDGVSFRDYYDVYEYVPTIPAGSRVWLDPTATNFALRAALADGTTVINAENPTTLPKSVKNETEVAHMRQAHIKDGVAVTRFVYWLKQNAGKGITELSAAKQLEVFRGMGENYLGPSFTPIIGYAEHAAIVHYGATEESDVSIEALGSVLCDTGGQYMDGTTDITRTVVLGEISDKEKEFFTRVLRGHLNLSAAHFLKGCTGRNLDYLAREPLWEIGEDFNHGTGHGVGFILNVHEGPQSIRWRPGVNKSTDAVMEAGMITSNEPGYYAEGEFGIRHENLIVCVNAEKKPCGQFLKFENLTMVPFDLEGVDPTIMTAKERALLNAYHKQVWETISPFLAEDNNGILEWLREATRAI